MWLEVNPQKKVVWEIKNKVPGTDVELKWMTCLQEMDNEILSLVIVMPDPTIHKFLKLLVIKKLSGNLMNLNWLETDLRAGRYWTEKMQRI